MLYNNRTLVHDAITHVRILYIPFYLFIGLLVTLSSFINYKKQASFFTSNNSYNTTYTHTEFFYFFLLTILENSILLSHFFY